LIDEHRLAIFFGAARHPIFGECSNFLWPGTLQICQGERLRWRMANDNSGSGEGWRIDTGNVSGCAPVPCPTQPPRVTGRPTPAPRPISQATTTPHAMPEFTPHSRARVR